MKKLISSILSALIGAVLGAGTVGKISSNKAKKIQSMSDKHLALFLIMNSWVKIKQQGISLSSYFEKHGYHQIAVYGMSYIGETLVDELKDSETVVVYGIDQRADSIYSDVDVVPIGEELVPVDAVVVTAVTFFKEIEEKLSEKMECPIISLEDILYEVGE